MAPRTDISTRALVVTLKSPFVGKSTLQIADETGLSPRTIDSIYARAISRGFEPNRPLKILPRFLEDAPRSGRPRKQEAISEEVIQKPRGNRYFIHNCVEGTQESWLPQDEANEEAWLDTEDDKGEAGVV